MSYAKLGNAIKTVLEFVNNNKINYALIGGLAVSFRTIERATKDIDIAIAVSNDKESENIIREFGNLGFKPTTLMENKNTGAISTVRMLSDNFGSIYLDLLFGATGIESEVVESSDLIELLPGLNAKIASLSSLIAMKILSSNNVKRRQDIIDLQNLIESANEAELAEAKHLINLIQERGFNPELKNGTNLIVKFENFCKEALAPNTNY